MRAVGLAVRIVAVAIVAGIGAGLGLFIAGLIMVWAS